MSLCSIAIGDPTAPISICTILGVVAGVCAFFLVNMFVWKAFSRLRDYVFDGEGIEARKILPFLLMLPLGAWKVFMYILMVLGGAAAIQSMKDNKRSAFNRYLD